MKVYIHLFLIVINVSVVFSQNLPSAPLVVSKEIAPKELIYHIFSHEVVLKKGSMYNKKTGDLLEDGFYAINYNNNYISSDIIARSGDSKKEGNVFKGKYKGKWKHYHKGILMKIENYKNGVLNGVFLSFNRIGDTIYQTNFKNGNGKYKAYYYKTGILKEEGNYKNGKKEGEWCFYTKNGTKTKTTVYNKGIPQ